MIEVVAGLRMIPVRTPTLPPATHTNAFIVGSREAVLIEPATPYDDELDRLVGIVRDLEASGLRFLAILATHHHPDHIGGAQALKERLSLPLWAHPLTRERTERQGLCPVVFDRLIEDGFELHLDGPHPRTLLAIHTPGHAPGHLCFLEIHSKVMIAGDMVASVGTILVEPEDGDMALYLESLERMRAFRPIALLPAHGEVITAPDALLQYYVAHRLRREGKVLAALIALTAGGDAVRPSDIVPIAYDDTPAMLWPLAERSTEAHLIKLVHDLRVERVEDRFRAV